MVLLTSLQVVVHLLNCLFGIMNSKHKYYPLDYHKVYITTVLLIPTDVSYPTQFLFSHPNQINNNITFTDVSCFGGSDATAALVPTGGTPPYSYLWNISPVSNLPTITQLPIGNYQLTVTDSLGCTSNSNVIIGQPNQLSATANIIDVGCNGGSNGEISLNINGGNPNSIGPNYTILWVMVNLQIQLLILVQAFIMLLLRIQPIVRIIHIHSK